MLRNQCRGKKSRACFSTMKSTESIIIIGKTLPDLTKQIEDICDVKLATGLGLKSSSVLQGSSEEFPVVMMLIFQPLVNP